MKMYSMLLVGFLSTASLRCMQESDENYSAKCLIVHARVTELCEEQSIIRCCDHEIQAELQKLDEQVASHQTMLEEQVALPQRIQDASRDLQAILRVCLNAYPTKSVQPVQSEDDWFWEE